MRRVVVSDGTTVQSGQQIGEVGELGNATGCHLHFEVHPHGGSIYEDPVNPTTWLARNVGKDRTGGFRVASFNVLGHSHTTPGGKHPGMASGPVRIRRALRILDRHRVDIVGMQEFQHPQAKTFRASGGRVWATFSARMKTENTIAWRLASFELVEGRLIEVPYFGGHRQPMPLVLLRRRSTGQLLWAFNVHNPATTSRYGAQERWRDAATMIELSTVRSLLARSDVPLVFTGDFNEHRESYCRLTASALLRAAPENSGGCRRPTWNGIDWIFGSGNVTFSDWSEDRGALVRRTTDHPLVLATVHIGNGA
jgi:endonuclease/exonuclease/phosphatase family metal-dependent hydrolase